MIINIILHLLKGSLCFSSCARGSNPNNNIFVNHISFMSKAAGVSVRLAIFVCPAKNTVIKELKLTATPTNFMRVYTWPLGETGKKENVPEMTLK